MFHYAVLVNTVGVLVGAGFGTMFKKSIPQRLNELLLSVVGLSTIGIGIRMVMQGKDFLMILISLVVGGILGELLELEKRIEGIGKRFKGSQGFAEAFLASSLLFLVGPMTIIGSINIGLTGNAELILTKSILDTISAMILSATMGSGVFLSAGSVFVVQGLLVAFSKNLTFLMGESFLGDFVGTGGVMVLGLGIRILKLRDVRVGNLLPSLLMIILIDWLKGLF